MENRFEKYLFYEKKNGKIVGVFKKALELADESFLLFKELYHTGYGSIEEEGNLISIHTGGWSENESLVNEFKETYWWRKNHEITCDGGHYYFDTDFHSINDWHIVSTKQINLWKTQKER